MPAFKVTICDLEARSVRLERLAEVAQQLAPAAAGGLSVMDRLLQLGAGDGLLPGVGLLVNKRRLLDHIAGAEREHTFARQPVTARATGLPVVALDVLGQVVVKHEAHVGFVDAHAEGNGRADHAPLVAQEQHPLFLQKPCDQFVRYVSPPHTNSASPVAKSHPFNVAEYGTAATQIAAMSIELDQLLARADQSATQLTIVGQRVEDGAKRMVHRAFWRGVALIVLLLTGSVLAGLAYRFLAHRLCLRADRS